MWYFPELDALEVTGLGRHRARPSNKDVGGERTPFSSDVFTFFIL